MSAQPQVVFGAGHVHITQIKDAKGNPISPPQVIAAPAVQNVAADFGKADTKLLYGEKEFAIHAAQGKKSTEVSFECGELYAQMLNALYFGQSVVAGSHSIYRDTKGRDVPANYATKLKIQNVVTLNLGKWVSDTGVTIKQGTSHVVATKITDVNAALVSGQYKCFGGRYYFAADDAGKETKITYTVLDKTTQGGTTGTSVVSTLKIPATRRYNSNVFTWAGVISGTGLTKKPYSTITAPAANEYQFASNGVLVFNSAQAANSLASRTVPHTTDGVKVSTVIAALPAAGYVTIVNPPSSTVFESNLGVVLTSGTIAGLAVGENLVQAATPTTGKFDVDAGGIYTFAAADADAIVTAQYVTDYMYMSTTPPDGEFIADKGVRNTDGIAFTRVELTTPLALLKNQYAVDDGGTYYVDSIHRAEKLYIDYEYSSENGVTLVMENNDMGSTPIVSLDISGIAEGQEWLIKYPRAIPKAFGFATKLDDFGTYKITYDVIADRVSNQVGTVYMTA